GKTVTSASGPPRVAEAGSNRWPRERRRRSGCPAPLARRRAVRATAGILAWRIPLTVAGQRRPRTGLPPTRRLVRVAAPVYGAGGQSDERDKRGGAHDQTCREGHRFVAELRVVLATGDSDGAQGVVGYVQPRRLAIDRHSPGGVVHLGQHDHRRGL